jgi:hypothetical protein
MDEDVVANDGIIKLATERFVLHHEVDRLELSG